MAKDKQPADAGFTGLLKWLVGLVWDADRPLGLAVVLVLIAVVTAIIALQTGIALDGIMAMARFVGTAIVAAIVLLALVNFFRRTIYGHVLVVFLMVLAMVGTTAFAAQFLSGDRIGWLTRSGCFYNPSQRGCPFSSDYDDRVVDRGPVERPTLDPQPMIVATDRPVAPTNTRPSAGTGTVAVDTPETVTSSQDPVTTVPAEIVFRNPLYVQFAGAIARGDVVDLARALGTKGWTVEGAERGGERTGAAAGLNEVRYFYAADRAAAEALARDASALVDWTGGDVIKVRDLTGAGYRPQRGLLELWTSRP